MSKRRLYGLAASRAFRSVWAMEEVGVEYEHVPTHFGAEAKTPEYLAVNPNGRVPALVDGDLVLFESMAINLYLAERYGEGLCPDSAEAGQPGHVVEVEPAAAASLSEEDKEDLGGD